MTGCCPRCCHLVEVEVVHARSFRSRLVGLAGDWALPERTGFFLSACKLIHTFGMRRPIDVVFVDALGCVLQVRRQVGAGRILGCLRAHGVIELSAGDAWRLGLHAGRHVYFRERAP